MASKSPERMKLQKPGETPALRTYFADMDKAAVGAIGERFGAFIPADRLKNLPDMASKFEGSHELHKAYRAEKALVSWKSARWNKAYGRSLLNPRHGAASSTAFSVGASTTVRDGIAEDASVFPVSVVDAWRLRAAD